MTPRKLSLGWPNPLGTFVGPDGPTLQRVFGDLSRHASFPLAGVRRAASQSVSSTDPVEWDQVLVDAAGLVDGSVIRCPSDFGHYWALGVAASSGVSTRWAVNGSGTLFTLSFGGLVERGDVVQVQATAPGTLTGAQAWAVFFPLN